MKKNEIFTFTAPNGAEVTAVVIDIVPCTGGVMTDTLYCYSQNRIFTYIETGGLHEYGKVIVDYAILPDYDVILENYYHQHEENAKVVQGFGYTRAEASNILEGKNADGSDFEKLPF